MEPQCAIGKRLGNQRWRRGTCLGIGRSWHCTQTIWDAAADIRAGRLKVLLPDYCVAEAGVFAVLHGNRYRIARVRVLLDFLVEHFKCATEELLRDVDVPRF